MHSQNDYMLYICRNNEVTEPRKRTNLLTRTPKVSKETSDVSHCDDSVKKEHLLFLVNAITVKKNIPFE